MLSETAQKWNHTGLLEKLDDNNANELALFFEDVANYISKKPNCLDGAEIFVFPIIRRIYGLIDKPGEFRLIVNFKRLIYLIKEGWDRFDSSLNKNEFMTGIGYEVVFVLEFVEKFLKDLKENGKY